jgi:hemoglobin
MYLAHKGLHLDEAQFNALVEGLQAAMDDCDVPFRTQNRLLAVLAPMERDVVTR